MMGYLGDPVEGMLRPQSGDRICRIHVESQSTIYDELNTFSMMKCRRNLLSTALHMARL